MTSTWGYMLAALTIVFGTTSAAGQDKGAHYEFRVWQFLPDSSRTSPGTLSGVATGDEDFHMFIALGSGPAPLAPVVRLDGDFVVHQLKDSMLLVGDITSIRVVSRDSTRLFARDLVRADNLESRTYRLRATITRRGTVWFYPFGVPRRGERGIAFELTSSDSEPAEVRRPPSDYRLPPGAVPITFGINGLTRRHRARVRVDVGDKAWLTVFEDDVLTRVPRRIALKGGARGQDLMFELEARGAVDGAQNAAGELCWRWFWADEQPPGGFGCGSVVRQEAAEQSLDGSAGLKMRVTLLPANRAPGARMQMW